ncbi:PD-(D/E)XK nuclease family protein [Clostridium chromiireducens]|uniref:PD-(D/E)XK nuclease family protein n=1 Tax=Clostridium chromiireducens TaxID=225345 RepID=UPI003AF756EF
MEKRLYFEPMFSDRRERLIDMCVDLQRQGKSFIYILPSREAIRDVRHKLLEKLGGFINSKIIMFDELENMLTEQFVNSSSIIFQDIEKLMIQRVCENLKDELRYFNKICTKNGFIEENKSFIKNLKRSMVSPEDLSERLENIEDPILKDKLFDLSLIYDEYTKTLRDKELFDVDDISLLSIEKATESAELFGVDTLIIDGFINIDKVNIELIRKVASLNTLNIYINCPYINNLSREFLEEEILMPFKEMGFKLLNDPLEFHKIKSRFKELSEKYYSGDKIEEGIDGITINKYPCIAAEVRETARSIKEKLIKGENPEDIAVFVNNKDEYNTTLHKIFKEFAIPLYMTYELPLSSFKFSRDLLSFIKVSDKSLALGEEWLKLLKEKIKEKELEVSKLAKEAFKSNLSYEDRFYLKSKEALEKLINDIHKGFNLGEILHEEIEKENFLNLYIDYLNNSTITLEKPINTGVKILNTDLAKGVYYKHVYVLGLNEGDIPKVIKNDGLFDELEIEKLKAIGVKYQDYLWELSREKIRFNLTLSSAEETLTLSYRSSGEDGSFTIASSLLDEVKYVGNLNDTKVVSMRDRFNIPFNKTMSSKELKAMELKDIFKNKYKGFESLNIDEKLMIIENFENNFKEMISSGLAEYHRGKEKEFNRFEGILKGNIEKIVLSKNSFSPSKLNAYFDCPFKYMLQYLFDLQEEQEEDDELSAMEIGDFYHRALYYYYDGLKVYEALDEGKFNSSFNKAIEEIREIQMSEDELQILRNKLWKYTKNFIECDLKRINKYEKESGNIIRPFFLEKFIESDIFGVLITSRVDRVDLEYEMANGKWTPTGKYIVYDYKKKSIPDIDKMLNKENCQIAFYHYFVNEYLKNELQMDNLDCMALLYLSVEGTNTKIKMNGLYRTEYKKALGFTGSNKFDMNKEVFYTFLEYLIGLIEESINNIRNGDFHYKLDCKCFEKFSFTSCAYNEVCRYSKSKMTVIMEAQI